MSMATGSPAGGGAGRLRRNHGHRRRRWRRLRRKNDLHIDRRAATRDHFPFETEKPLELEAEDIIAARQVLERYSSALRPDLARHRPGHRDLDVAERRAGRI